jgi:transglutaminase-like putative cysteine protease
MRRTLAAAVVPCLVIASLWLRLERPREIGAAVLVAGFALVPALVRPRLAAALGAALATAGTAFHVSPLRHPGAILAGFENGFLDFYDVTAPFDPRLHPDMRGTVLVGVFAFCLAVSLAVAARRTGLAVAALLVGAGWPATLVGGGNELARGGVILLAVLAVLVGLSRRPSLAAVPAAVVLALVAAAASPAVARRELVAWQRWDFYTRPDAPVGVSYVWDSQYAGLRWPRKKTVVLRIEAPARSLYWRAASLDVYTHDRWLERPAPRTLAATGIDPLLPAAAHESRELVAAKVKVAALADTHLVGASEPVRFDARGVPLLRPAYGVAELAGGLTRGFTYTAYSYAPAPSAAQLVRSRARYPHALTRPGGELDLEPGIPAPPFGSANRAARLAALFRRYSVLELYRPLVHQAERVAGRARTPYAATVEVESWLRFRGGFTYSDEPPLFPAGVPPLVGFVAQTKRGYCQHFAGAMTLMLRYLGVPARVAVGFTSGTYDASKREWTVTDHDAHAWVEVWFRGYGWLPFDPTPGRGQLSSPYSAASPRFPAGVGKMVAAALGDADGSAGTRFGAVPFAGAPVSAHRSHGRSVLPVLALLVAGAVAVLTLTKLVVRRVRYLTRDPRRLASACRRELAEYLLDQRLDAARSATLHELRALVRDELAVDASAFVAAASAARFGAPAAAPGAARRARAELRLLRRSLRARLTAWERLRGLLSLRSLGLTT